MEQIKKIFLFLLLLNNKDLSLLVAEAREETAQDYLARKKERI